MTTPEPTPEFDDQLLSEAAAFDADLRQGSNPNTAFDRKHGDLANVLRLLHDVFASSVGEVDSAAHAPEREEAFLSHGGRFQIVSLLGRGGFASVYRAYDQVLQRDVAIKLIPGSGGQDDDLETAKPLIEARAVARLSHPNIVPLYEVHREGKAFCLVSEFCAGPTLGQWLTEHQGPIEPQVGAEIVRNLAEGVAHAHARGLAHRDIKPGNVLLAPTDERDARLPFTPRLTDFGLARDLESFGAGGEVQQLSGTLDYMAPEQVLDNEQDSRSACDVYALGVLLYRLLTGRQPHQAGNRLDLMHDICTQPPSRLRNHATHIPRDLEAICLKCLAKSPAERYATARGLADDIGRWQDGRGVMARPLPTAERLLRAIRKSPLASVLIAAIILMAIFSAIVLARANRRLLARGAELRAALRESQTSETRAITAETAATAAAREADRQRWEAETNLESAVTTAYQADLSRGFDALRRKQFAEAHRIADEVERYAGGTIPLGVDLRILQALARQSWQPLAAHAGAVHAIVPLPGTDSLLTAGADGIVRWHDLDQGTVVHETSLGPDARIWALDCSSDGACVAAGYSIESLGSDPLAKHAIALLERGSAEARRTLSGYPTTVESLAFFPDDRRLAIGCRYQPLLVQSLADPAGKLTLDSDRRNEEIVLSPDGRAVTAFCARHTIRRYDASDGRVLEEATLDQQPYHLAGSPNGRWLAISLYHHPHVLLYDATDLSHPCRHLSNPFGATSCLAFSPSSQRLAAGLRSGGVIVWDLGQAAGKDSSVPAAESPEEIPWLEFAMPHAATVTALAMPTDALVASGAQDGSVSVSNLQGGFRDMCEGFSFASRCACLAPGDKSILLGGVDGSLASFELTAHRLEIILPARGVPLVKLSISPTGDLLALGWESGEVALMQIAGRTVLHSEPPAHSADLAAEQVNHLAFDGRGEHLMIVRGADTVQVWQCAQGAAGQIPPRPLPFEIATVANWHSERNIAAVCFLTGTDQLAYGGQAEEIRRVAVLGSAEHVHISEVPAVTALLCDEQRQTIISGHANGRIRRYDRTGQLVAECSHTVQPFLAADNTVDVSALTLSPDGANLVSGNRDGEVRLWDAVTLRYLGTAHEPDGRGAITNISFARDGTKLMIHQALRPNDPHCGVHLIMIPQH